MMDSLAGHITNTLPPVTNALVTGIIGDQPSRYAKTPILWNAAYRELGWDAISLPWDVPPDRLTGFLTAVRTIPAIAGFSVTNPHKIAVVPLLDDLDPLARQIGAVNTVARTDAGKLVGYNTDGQGAIDALTRMMPGMDRPFIEALEGRTAVVIGAGGAARAVAFYLAQAIGRTGVLRIVNRAPAAAVSLAAAVHASYGIGEGGGEPHLANWLSAADLIVNATVKGQAGWRRLPDGTACTLEPYSSLAPANPARLPADRPLDAAAARESFLASRQDIERNLTLGLERIATLRPSAVCFDLIYAPLETAFLRDARLAGHGTQNGKWMNIAQAADAFARKVLGRPLAVHGLSEDDGYRRALDVMARVW